MRKLTTCILALMLMLGILTGCGQKPASQPTPTASAAGTQTPTAPSETPAPTDAATRTITDGLGREIEVPAKVERIVTLGNASRMATYLQLQDKMVTVTSGDQSDSAFMAYGWYNQETWAGLPVAASGGYGVIHPEVILDAEPDVILCTYEADIVADIEAQLGCKVVAAPQGTLFGEDYDLALRVFGDACGVPERAEAVIAFVHDCLDDLSRRTADIPESDKASCLGAAATFRGGHGIGGVYANNAVFATIHANDAALGLTEGPKGVEIDREQILAWDPDMIILDAGNIGLVQEEYAVDPAFFQQLAAVQNGKVYQWPNATANYTNVEIPLVSGYYVGNLLFPEAFGDVDFTAKANEIFAFFLGHEGYLDMLTEKGLGYGQVTLGR